MIFIFQDSDIHGSSQKRAKLDAGPVSTAMEEFNFETILEECGIPSPDNSDMSILDDLFAMVDNIQNPQEFHSSPLITMDPSYKTLASSSVGNVRKN